jgi:hypothetical protein
MGGSLILAPKISYKLSVNHSFFSFNKSLPSCYVCLCVVFPSSLPLVFLPLFNRHLVPLVPMSVGNPKILCGSKFYFIQTLMLYVSFVLGLLEDWLWVICRVANSRFVSISLGNYLSCKSSQAHRGRHFKTNPSTF